MQKPFYVYVHRRASDNRIFYVGQGTAKYRRAYQTSKKHRSAYWARVAEKHGLVIEIWSWWDTQKEACDEERKLISFFRSVGAKLVNITEGGEGTLGRKQPPRIRKILSDCAKERTGKNSQRGLKTVVEFVSGETKTFDTGREAAKFLGVEASTLCGWIKGTYHPSPERGIKSVTNLGDRLAWQHTHS